MAAANYFFKAADNSKAYRVDYEVAGSVITINGCYCTGVGLTLPSGGQVNSVDSPVKLADVLVDVVLAAVAASDVASYRAIAAATADSVEAAEKATYATRW